MLKILAIIAILTVGFLISVTDLGSGGLISTFLLSFGLFCVIGVTAMLVLAKKRTK